MAAKSSKFKIVSADTKMTINSMYFSFKIEYSNSQRNGFRKSDLGSGVSYQSMHNIL